MWCGVGCQQECWQDGSVSIWECVCRRLERISCACAWVAFLVIPLRARCEAVSPASLFVAEGLECRLELAESTRLPGWRRGVKACAGVCVHISMARSEMKAPDLSMRYYKAPIVFISPPVSGLI